MRISDWSSDVCSSDLQGGVRFVGPNTNGLVSLGEKLVASTSMVCAMNPFLAGDIAFIAQSGGVGGSMFGGAMEDLVGFSHWVSTGNEADLDAAEVMDALVDNDRVRVFALFLEGVRDAPKFLAACRKAARARKPIVVYKIGLAGVAAQVSASHTGALAGRSEEHTSELQSLMRISSAVFCLKKKKTIT